MNYYYQLARKFAPLDRQRLADELRAFHQQAVDAATEMAAETIRQGRADGEPLEKIEADVRLIRLDGGQIAEDRLRLRHVEAVLYVLTRNGTLTLLKSDIATAFDAGHGIDIVGAGAGGKAILPQPGKFNGE